MTQIDKCCDLVMKGGSTSGVLYPSTVHEIAKKMYFVGIGGTSAGAIAAALTAAAEYRRRHTGSFEGFDMLEATAREIAEPGKLLSLFRPDEDTSDLFETFFAALQGRLGFFAKAKLGKKLLTASGREKLLRPVADNGYGLASGMANGNDVPGMPPITTWLADLIDKIAGKTNGPLTFRDLRQAPIPDGLAPVMNGHDRRSIDLMAVTTCITLSRPFELPFSTNIFAFDPEELRKFFPERIVKHLEGEAATIIDDLAKEGETSSRDRDGKKPLSADGMPVAVAARMSMSFPALFTMIPLWAVDYGKEDKPLDRLWFSDGGITSNLPIQRFDSIYPRWPTLGVSLRYTDESDQPGRSSLRRDKSWIYFPDTRRALRDLWSGFDLKKAGVARLLGFAMGIFNSAQTWHDEAFLRMPGFRDRVIEIWLNSEEGGLNLEMEKTTIERLVGRGREAGRLLVERYASDSTETLSWSDHRWARFRSGMPGLIQTILKFKRAVDVDQGNPKLLELLGDQKLPASYEFASEEDRSAAEEVTRALLELAGKIERIGNRPDLGQLKSSAPVFEHRLPELPCYSEEVWAIGHGLPGDLIRMLPDSKRSTRPPEGELRMLPDSKRSTRPPEGELRINAWVSERTDRPLEPLNLDETYTLNLKVGEVVAASLLYGKDTILDMDAIPKQGLLTSWEVISCGIRLEALSPETKVTVEDLNPRKRWTGRFDLLIERTVGSPLRQLRITPIDAENPSLDVLIYSGSEPYRQFNIEFRLHDAASAHTDTSAMAIGDELTLTPHAHLNLRTTHEWTTPPGELTISVISDAALVRGDVRGEFKDETMDWVAVPAKVAGRIQNVRDAAEQFRTTWQDYLNDIEPNDLDQQLGTWTPDYHWGNLQDLADANHQTAWDQVSHSQELRALAHYGRKLYDAFFPTSPPSKLRGWIDSLEPGHRLNFSWLPTRNPNWMAHVPWGLMYCLDLPAALNPVDPMGFLGLRYRIAYSAHAVEGGSKALGPIDIAHRTHFLYWGTDPADETGQEALLQRQQWSVWDNQIFVPQVASNPQAKQELLAFLANPSPSPITLVYLFCKCSVGQGNNPLLRFGNTKQASDLVSDMELSAARLDEHPLVFANACATSAADPYMANELEQGFFERGCRAFLGTETKVPIQLASRFASIFFRFFYRKIDPDPMAAGEAVAQTRLFLWTRYKNIGGLFYTYVNLYELFVADDAEVRALR